MSFYFTLSRFSSSRRAAWAGLSLAGALLAACASADGPKPAVVVPPVASAGAKVLRISELNAGADVTLESGQPLVVSLEMEIGPNLDWTLVDMKPGVLTIESTRFERSPRDNYLGDLGGQMIWTLKPVAPGAVTLNFDLRKPHSLMPAVRTITYRVVVK
ncbi:MAG TPA: protease inhibitor I42 family protein [Burkholderiaceae bacterium]|jgi:predicted secreted protein